MTDLISLELVLWWNRRKYFSDERFGMQEAAETFLQAHGEFQWYTDKDELNIVQFEDMQQKLREERQKYRNYRIVKHDEFLTMKHRKEVKEDTVRRQAKIIKGLEKILNEEQKQRLEELRCLSTGGLTLKQKDYRPLPPDITRFADNGKLYMEIT